MRETPVCTAADAIYKLAAGNLKYLNAENGSGDISRRIRMSTWTKGQSPYAIIVTCSDSRVIPENIFSAGIGELFVKFAVELWSEHECVAGFVLVERYVTLNCLKFHSHNV